MLSWFKLYYVGPCYMIFRAQSPPLFPSHHAACYTQGRFEAFYLFLEPIISIDLFLLIVCYQFYHVSRLLVSLHHNQYTLVVCKA